MKVLAIANHKGGTGKTATARALGDVLSAAGVRVLMVDVDPQGSLSTSCGFSEVDPNLADVMGDSNPGGLGIKKVIRSVNDGLALAPSSLSMAAVELGLINRYSREHILERALSEVQTDYDLVLIDCPPSLSLLVVNALTASNAVLIPCQPMPVDMAGVKLFLQTIEAIRRDLNPQLSIFGILPTFYDARLVTHNGAIESMQKADWPVLPVRVGRSVRVGESAALGESIITFEPDNPQATAYLELGKLVKRWLAKSE